HESLCISYGVKEESLYKTIQSIEAYKGVKAPKHLRHRYIFEDVPTGLVPYASLGEMIGVSTPSIKAFIRLASTLHGLDYWQEGRTVERLGLAGLSVEEITELVTEG
ncbi:MAG: NADP transhydrogenase subunit alpha, partial [Nitrososphaeria archaeon]|nr:NADP transhydrogenase subunit alpha [Nitrososphaeria archaeon]